AGAGKGGAPGGLPAQEGAGPAQRHPLPARPSPAARPPPGKSVAPAAPTPQPPPYLRLLAGAQACPRGRLDAPAPAPAEVGSRAALGPRLRRVIKRQQEQVAAAPPALRLDRGGLVGRPLEALDDGVHPPAQRRARAAARAGAHR